MNKLAERNARLGVIGLGGRGYGLLNQLLGMEDVDVPAICDRYEDRLCRGAERIAASGRAAAERYEDYRQLLARDDLDGVIVSTSWTSHAEIAIVAMNAGKAVGCEVGGALSLEDMWELVRTAERTGAPFMLLENCCYGRHELAVWNMVRQGLFGELVHCQCGYEHDLRKEVATGSENRHYRLRHYLNRNGDLYPTHGIGPIAKLLGINRGNRFVSLTSMSSKARGLAAWTERHLGPEHPAAKADAALGDIVTTMIRCAGGETIAVIHDTTLPRPYSRAGRVQGTKGIWMEDNRSIHLEGRSPAHTWEPFDDYMAEYEHPLWKWYTAHGVREGHGGMDYLCLRSFVESLRRQTAPPIDVYDAAAWMAVTVLSEQSVALGSQPVAFPDFTNGKWMSREPAPSGKYGLDVLDVSAFEAP
ncbi:Gfo/Idh/MocA family protein [Paenibacillus flagellatus]|uniref:Glycosyl hydrolase n=1 Tax=Paenibacillus flagellatus TaxID=2211139 RepID=A0A2V5K792_9BACL|nr:Gfo/Idh/MocA family oxidoreductase [Paenibacillus flagellatus]PYI53814.1 glycosyl hydrolase [Paenibacillus flagellatus]